MSDCSTKRVMCIWLPNWPSQRASAARSPANPASAAGCPNEKVLAPESRNDGDLPPQSPLPPNALIDVSREENSSSSITNKPLVLFQRDTRRGNIVATANQTARKLGIYPQMPLSQCGSICPDAELIEYDPQSDLEELVHLAEQSQCFSPIVGIENLDSEIWAGRSLHEPQGIVADITGIPSLFGGEAPFAQHVSNWFRQRGYLCAIGIANQIGLAWGLANYQSRASINDALLKWESTRERGPILPDTNSDSLFQLLHIAHPTHAPYWHLPIEALRLEVAIVAKLHRLGIKRISQLMELPRNGLTSRFGPKLIMRIDQFQCTHEEPIRTLHPTPQLALDCSYEYPTPDHQVAFQTITHQLKPLCSELEKMGQGAVRIVCRLALEKNSFDTNEMEVKPQKENWNQRTRPYHETDSNQIKLAHVFQLGLFRPSSDFEYLEWLLKLQWEHQTALIRSTYWIRGVSTQITMTGPMEWKQSSLFESETNKHRDTIASLVDSLSVRLGREQVLSPVIRPNPLPELSYEWHPMTGLRKDGTAQQIKKKLKRAPKSDYQSSEGTLGPHKEDAWRRPVKMLHPPQPLKCTEVTEQGVPKVICYPKTNQLVVRMVGPERIESGWWQGASQRRDYFRAELKNGIWLWIYRDRNDQSWLLHGIFD